MKILTNRVAFCFIFVLYCHSVVAEVLVESKIDSIAMWIGEQTEIHLEVTCESGSEILFPMLNDTIVSGLEIVPPVRRDTQYVNRKKRMIVTQHYTVTSFDSAQFYIPPFRVMVDSTVYYSRSSLYLAVYMFDVDTLNKSRFFGPKEIINQPFIWKDIKNTLLYLFSLLFMAVLALFLYKKHKEDKPIVRILKIEPELSAHKRALDKIERLKEERLAQRGNPKKFYTELTDAVREYINERFGFFATEMTSAEIIDRLMNNQDDDIVKELANLLKVADLVKFAKYNPLLNENDQNLLYAVEFVKNTIVESDSENSVSTEQKVVIESKRGKKSRAVLLTVIIIASLLSTLFLVLLVRQVYYLFF